ncbi:MAG: hypothetical protein QOI08_2971 [Actinomycetota bacterium]|nr:hypothetical protein [Actinomycetota bacterium]
MNATLAIPPSATGGLTNPPTSDELRRYVEQLAAWRATLDHDLDALDRRAQSSRTPDAYSDDVSLAMALRASIDARGDDLVRLWDGGRVGATELARAAELMWGRLPDTLGNPSAFSLTEACTLVSALYERIATQLSGDAIAGSGATDEIVALRETLDRASRSARALRRREDDVVALSLRLETLLNGATQTDIAARVSELANEAFALEASLIKEIGLRATVTNDASAAASTRSRLLSDEATVRATAAEARLKIAVVPTLAIPSVDSVGEAPGVPVTEVDAAPGSWTEARTQLDAYLAQLARIDAALQEAAARYGAGLARRADLRGLLGAYRDRAQRSGLGEDDALAAQYESARDVLYSAPCDIAEAERLVSVYQQSVLAATSPREKETR